MRRGIHIAIFYFIFVFSGISSSIYAQTVPSGLFYQTVLRNSLGQEMASQQVNVRFSIMKGSASGLIVWQEDHSLTTDLYGKIIAIIGTGVSTGAGSLGSFNQIDWKGDVYFLQLSTDVLNSGSYTNMGVAQLFSVPYAFYSIYSHTSQVISVQDLTDVNLLSNTSGKLLKWNGLEWYAANDLDSDTASYSLATLSANSCDTAGIIFVVNLADTVDFSYEADSAIFALNAENAQNVPSSTFSDTALFALSSPSSAWNINGNQNPLSFTLGTTDNAPFKIRTNNTEQFSLTNTGQVRIGNSSLSANLSIFGNDGVIVSGTLGNSFSSTSPSGTRFFWYPSNGKIRAGEVASSSIDTSLSNTYSASFGYNASAREASFCSGYESSALDYSIAIGRRSQSNGVGAYPRGNTIALGDSCLSFATRSVTIGKDNFADSTATFSGSTAVLVGYKNKSIGVVSMCLGSYNYSGNTRTVAIGHHAYATHNGSFVFSDASSSANTNSSANFQFSARASGGVVFYTDSASTMGVTLAPGSGSWSVISDKNKKSNFEKVNHDEILTGISQLKITEWNYKSQDHTVHHLGPMAQDFYKIFKFGESRKSISSVDMDGIILSGIKALSSRVNDLNKVYDETETIKEEIEKLDNYNSLNSRLNAIQLSIKNINE